MMTVPHIGFILAAYAVTAATMVGLMALVLLEGRALRRGLERLDPRRGVVAVSGRPGRANDRSS